MSTDTCIRGVKVEIPKHPNICSLLIKITFCGLSSIVSRPMSCDGRNRAFLVQEKTSVWWSSSNHMERQSHKPERVVRESPCYGPQQRPKRQSSLALLVPGNGLVCNICSSKEKTEYRESNRSNMILKVLIQHICPCNGDILGDALVHKSCVSSVVIRTRYCFILSSLSANALTTLSLTG